MNPFQYNDHPSQAKPFSTNPQFLPSQSSQISSTAFYYQSGSFSHSSSLAPFNALSMYNNSAFQAQGHQEMTTFIPPISRKNYTGPDLNLFNQSFEKTISTIQADNQLCKQDYLKFLKQRKVVQDKLQEISKMNDFKLKIESLENLSKTKTILQDARLLIERIHQTNDQTEFPEVGLIVQDIEACETVTRKIQDFLAKYNSKVKNCSEHAGEVGAITRGFNELMKEIGSLILIDVEILYEWNIFEWYLMVKLELRKEPGSLQLRDLEHWNDLKKFASTSEMLSSTQYEKICQQINAYELIKEITEELKKQENLILQNKENKEEMAEIRKKLMKKAELEGLLKEIQGCYVRVSKEKVYIEELLERTGTVTHLYTQRKLKQKKLSQSQVDKFSRLFERLPMQTQEEEEINGEKLKAENIVKTIENNMALLQPNVNLQFAKTIHEEYQNCLVEIPYAWWLSEFYLRNQHKLVLPIPIPEEVPAQENKDSSSSLLGKRKEPHESREYKRSQLSTTNKSDGEVSDDSSDESTPPKEKGKKKRSAIFEPKKKIKNQNNSLAPGFKIEVSDFRREKANAEILKAMLKIMDLPKNRDPVLISRRLEESVYNRYLNNRDSFASHVASICKFFGDLNSSKKTQEKIFATTMEYEHILECLGEGDSKSMKTSENTGKMQIENPIKDITNTPTYLMVSPLLRHESSHNELQRQMSKEGGNEEGEKVDSATREKTREEFEELVKGLEGYEVLKDVKQVVKELEKKVYARYFLNKVNYEKRAESICNFLVELRGYPCLRRKVLRQNLEYGEIRNYLDTALARFDTQAYEEERKQSLNQKEEFDTKLELEQLFAKTEGSMGSEKLPIWTPPVDFKLPEISGLTIPDVMKIGVEENTEPLRIELEEDENKENFQMNCELAKIGEQKETQKMSHYLKKTGRKESSKDAVEFERRKEEKTPLCIKRIFYGKLRQKLSRSYSDSLPCSFDTYASNEQVSQFPRLLNGVPHFDIALASPFLHDLHKFVNKEKSSFQKVLVGWVSAPSFVSDLFTSILQFLIEKKSVGAYSYLFGAEIYLVPSKLVDGRYQELKETLNWVCLDPEEAPVPDKQLLFAICLTDQYETRSYTKMMKAKKMLPGRSSRVTAEVNEDDQEKMAQEEGEVLADQVLKYRKKQLELAVQTANEGV